MKHLSSFGTRWHGFINIVKYFTHQEFILMVSLFLANIHSLTMRSSFGHLVHQMASVR